MAESWPNLSGQLGAFGGVLADRQRRHARNYLLPYCQSVYPPYKAGRHHRFIIEKLEAVERGERLRTMVSEPPQHGKSLTVSQLFSSWFVGRDPRRRVVVASYGDDRASDIGRAVLRTLRDQRHREIFPGCEVDESAASSTRVDLVAGGGFLAVSRNGALTGRSADLLIADDLLKDAKEAQSAAVRRECIEWYTRVALTRLAPGAPIILVGTRWGRGDLFDYLLEECKQEGWDVINLAALAEPGDPLGRREGEPLWPERYGLEVLQQKRAEIGSSAWVCLYQGQPAAAEGVILHREWFQYYTSPPERFSRKVISLDSAFKTASWNDYSVAQVWGQAENGYYLLANWRGRVEFPALKRMLVALDGEWRPHEVLIEDSASGQSLIQELQASTAMPLKPIRADRDKESRAAAVTPLLEGGRVYLPQNAPWLNDFLDEVCAFPRAPHDDMVDAMVQALTHLRGDSMLGGWLADLGHLHAQQQAGTITEDGAARLRKFEGFGLTTTTAPYYGPSGPAPTLAEAQKQALAGEARSQFTAPQRLDRAMAQQKPRPKCPVCANPNLAILGEFRRCVCGWDTNQITPTEEATRDERHV